MATEMITSYASIHHLMLKLADQRQAAILQGFFKTGPGEYGEGDVFLGIKVPATRTVVRQCRAATRPVIRRLLRSRLHEERLLALLVLVDRFTRGDDRERRQIYQFYLANTAHINNWDLVDLSAPNVVGAHLLTRPRRPLYHLAKSGNLWERRIAVLATYAFIRAGQFTDTLKLARLLIRDPEDLMHKAIGWMLREVGKRDPAALEQFLQKHYRHMPRTMLRYAIERFPESRRKDYLLGRV
jgi:3-methyladenine DNA glycosylase AlkD